jgi:hypothetical protein
MFKNTAGQSVTLSAFDASTGLQKTGDSANMVFYVSKDDGAVTAISSNSGVPTESDATNAKGDYKIAVSQTETNADKLRFSGKSSTSNIVVVAQTIYTVPANFTTLSVDGSGRVDVIKVNGTSQTARDLGASVLLSTGTGTGQLDFTSGVVKANATQWLGGTIPAVNVTGVPLVDAKYLLGTIFATPATAGVVDVNAKNINNVSTGSVTTINANQGTTQPVNFTGTAGSALVKTDMIDVNGVAYGSSTLNTLASHDPGATLGTSTLTQTQVTGGAYSVQSASCVLGDARVAHLDADVSSRMATFTLPTNFSSLAITVGGAVTVGTNNDKTGYTLTVTPPTAAQIATAIFTDTTASDFTTASSPGKILVTQLGGTFTTTSSSVFTTAALANGPSGSGPTVQQIVNGVWDEPNASHLTAGSTGQKLNSAGGAADPLLNAVPGSYAAGTAGDALGKVTAIKAKTDLITAGGQVTLTGPVTANGTATIYSGDDYSSSDASSIDFTDPGGQWPDLTGATPIQWRIDQTVSGVVKTQYTLTGSVVVAGGSTQKVRFQPTAAQSAALVAALQPGVPQFQHFVVFTLASGHVVTRVTGIGQGLVR